MNVPAQRGCLPTVYIQTLQCLNLSTNESKGEMHPCKSNLISPGFRPASSDKRVASPSNTPPAGMTSSSPTPATPGRWGDFTRVEYAWRHQLKIMEDLDKVLQRKPTNQGRSSTKKTHSRPRSMTREETRLSLSPAKGKIGKVKSERKVITKFCR